MKVTEANLKNHFRSNGVHKDIVHALEGRGFFKKIADGLKHADAMHAGIISAGKITKKKAKTSIKLLKPTKRTGGKLTAGYMSAGKLTAGKLKKKKKSESGGILTAGKLKKKKKSESKGKMKKEKTGKRKLPPALKAFQEKLKDYVKKHRVSYKEAMIALKKK